MYLGRNINNYSKQEFFRGRESEYLEILRVGGLEGRRVEDWEIVWNVCMYEEDIIK